MRDFRNAKTMAKTLREALAARSLQLSHSESLELIAQVLGARNWQTLSAAIEAEEGRPSPGGPVASPAANPILPVIPMRDMVVFPEMTLPLFAGRPKTLRAVERAMASDRRLFVITQRRQADDTPATADLFQVGVTAIILNISRPTEGVMKLTVQAERRTRLVRLSDSELLEAEVEPLEAPAPDEAAKVLAQDALERFSHFKNYDLAAPPIAMAGFRAFAANPGLLADLITPHVATRLDQAQELLEMLEPAVRLERLIALTGENRKAA